MFAGIGTAEGPQQQAKRTAKGPQPSAGGRARTRLWGDGAPRVGCLAPGGGDVLGEVLAPDAQWYGAEDGQFCDGRKAIIEVKGRNLAGRVRGRIEETSKTRRSLTRLLTSLLLTRSASPGPAAECLQAGDPLWVVSLHPSAAVSLALVADPLAKHHASLDMLRRHVRVPFTFYELHQCGVVSVPSLLIRL